MIGLDTNVLLRVFIDDNPEQVAAVHRFVKQAPPFSLFVSDIVLAELVWTMKRRFRAAKADLVALLRQLIERAEFVLENRSDVREAVRLFAQGPADFGDCLIYVQHRRLGISKTVSFGEAAIEMQLFVPLET